MKLEHWVTERLNEARGRDEKATRRSILEGLAQASGVSYMTLAGAERGARMGLYEKARAVSVATGFLVTIPELCADPALEDPRVQDQFRALLEAQAHG